MSEASSQTLVLPAAMDVANARKVYTLMQSHLSGAGDLELDGEAVERMDAAGVQLVYAFCRELRSQKRSLLWRGLSEPLLKALALSGVQEACGLPAQEALEAQGEDR